MGRDPRARWLGRLLFVAGLLLWPACAQILDIEEQKLAKDAGDKDAGDDEDAGQGEDAGPDAAGRDAGEDGEVSDAAPGDAATDAGDAAAGPTPECKSYCDTVMSSCTDEFSAYRNEETCFSVCARLVPGDPDEPEGNTLACRAREAMDAPAEPPFHCPRAAPGGAGACGTNCESYCALYEEVCPDRARADCVPLCEALPDRGAFDAPKDYGAGTDTVQCRLAHLSAAAVAQPEVHCRHSGLAPVLGDPCNLHEGEAPNCRDYCKLLDAVCTDDLSVYESRAQCEKACTSFEVGIHSDTEVNTLACRRYHTYAALISPDAHCPHTGVGGDGHCGELCVSYCSLLESGCGDEFEAEFGSAEACQAQCLTLTGNAKRDQGYSTKQGAVDGASIQCRLFSLTQALAGDTASCAGAVGLGRCDG